jgi:hypothetical protein
VAGVHAYLLRFKAVPVAPAAGVLELLAGALLAVVVPPRDLDKSVQNCKRRKKLQLKLVVKSEHSLAL